MLPHSTTTDRHKVKTTNPRLSKYLCKVGLCYMFHFFCITLYAHERKNMHVPSRAPQLSHTNDCPSASVLPAGRRHRPSFVSLLARRHSLGRRHSVVYQRAAGALTLINYPTLWNFTNYFPVYCLSWYFTSSHPQVVFGRPYYRSSLWYSVSSVVCRLWRFVLWQNGAS